MNVTFIFDDIIVSTTVDATEVFAAVEQALLVIAEHGLDGDRAGEIQVDGEIFED